MKKIIWIISFVFLLISCTEVNTSIETNRELISINSDTIHSWSNDTWIGVNNENFGTKIPGYAPLGISFSYPSYAIFDCCSLRQFWSSIHLIEIDSNPKWNSPYIRLMKYTSDCDPVYKYTDFPLKGMCKWRSPSIDEYSTTISGWTLPLTFGLGFTEVPNSIQKDIKNFVFQTDDNTYLIQFHNFQILPTWFIDTFLSKIKKDETLQIDDKNKLISWTYFHDKELHYTIQVPRDWWTIYPIGWCIHDDLYGGMEFIMPIKYDKICRDGTSYDTLLSYGIAINSYIISIGTDNIPYDSSNMYDFKQKLISDQILEYDAIDKTSWKYAFTVRFMVDHQNDRKIEFKFNKYNPTTRSIINSIALD